MFDILIKNIKLENTIVDLGLEFKDVLEVGKLVTECWLKDFGDLSLYSGLLEIDLQGKQINQLNMTDLKRKSPADFLEKVLPKPLA